MSQHAARTRATVSTSRARQKLPSLREKTLVGTRIYLFQPPRVGSAWHRHLIRLALIDSDDGATLAPVPRGSSVGVSVIAMLFAFVGLGLGPATGFAIGIAALSLAWFGTFALIRAATMRWLFDNHVLVSATND